MKKFLLSFLILLMSVTAASAAIQVQMRRDTAANWVTANPILAQGEWGIEQDTLKAKIGNGVTAWNSLTYFVGTAVPAGMTGQFNYNNAGIFAAGNMLLTDGTNVGIGSLTPMYKLSVAGVVQSSTGGFRFPDNTTQTTAATATPPAGTGTELQYRVSGSFGAVTGSGVVGGNIGIGSVNPTQAVDVNGTVKATAFVGSGAGLTGTLANPSGTIGLAAVNGSATTGIRSDGAPALSQAIIPTWTGTHVFSNATAAALFNTGNVGIHTLTPGTALDVTGTVRATLHSGSGAGLTSIPDSGLTLTDVTTNNATTSRHGFLLKLDNNSAHFMDGTGAWSTPAGGGSGGWTLGAGNVGITTTNNVGIGTTGSPSAALIVMGGNVGVGSVTPGTAVDVVGTVRTSAGFQSTAAGISTWASSNGMGIDGINATYTTPNLAVNTSGNVAIGTANAPQKLYVAGTAQMTGFKMDVSPTAGYVLTTNSLGVGTWAPTGAGGGGTVSSGTANQVAYYNADGTTVVGTSALSTNNTNVGVGTIAPITILDVNRKFNVTTGGNVGIGSTAPSFGLDVNNTNGVILRQGTSVLIQNQNVGIGTASAPNGKLAVFNATAIGKATCWGLGGCAGYCTAGTYPNCSTCTCN